MIRRRNGFTIIELLIATTVFSVVLLVISAAIIQIGRIYYKGVTGAQTQETTRTILSDITQAIQFTSGQIVTTYDTAGNDQGTDSIYAICVGNRLYSYKFGQQREESQHAMVVRDVTGGCIATAASLDMAVPSKGFEMLAEHMRLSDLHVEAIPGATETYRVSIRVVYGDDDLLCSDSLGNCSSAATMSPTQLANARDLRCKDIRAGTQFCATSELSTIVERRLKS